jgi:fusion and transport protein UGO1
MSIPREGPNPLRPYYNPPSIGILHDAPGATSSGTHGLGPRHGSAASYASSARDMFSEIDYRDYMSDASPSTRESTRKALDEALYRYFSILLSQPFEVAKTVLQVRRQDGDVPVPGAVTKEIRPRRSSYRDSTRHSVVWQMRGI